MFNFSFTAVSGNSKTGPMPVTRTDARSCPDACILKKNGCYAEYGPAYFNWIKLNDSGLTIEELATKIRKLPKLQLWRHNEAGDLPGQNDLIDKDQLNKLVAANKGKRGFTYSHYPLTVANIEAMTMANVNGFTINASCNNLNELQAIENVDLPKVVIVTEDKPNRFKHGNTDVLICPAQIKDSITCLKCGLCQQKDRDFAIGFKAHGNGKKKVINIAKID